MSNSNEILKKCFRCEIKQLIENFNKEKNRKDGLFPLCIGCRKDSYLENLDKISENIEQNREKRNTYLKNKRETDGNFRLISNTRNRIYKSLNGMTKQSATKPVLGIDIETYGKWLEFQFTPEMNWSNTEIDHVKPICNFVVSNDEEVRDAFKLEKHSALIERNSSTKGNEV